MDQTCFLFPEHMKIQHQGKQVPTKRCPICLTAIQKLKNHLKLTHKMSKSEADELYERCDHVLMLKFYGLVKCTIVVSRRIYRYFFTLPHFQCHGLRGAPSWIQDCRDCKCRATLQKIMALLY